jgi:beta-lactamase superfamily II metal-dependent hydrolase
MFRVTMIPADHGDCLWVEVGPERAPKQILIDAGTPGTYKRLKKVIAERFGDRPQHFDLFVISHIDSDHIGGAVPLLADRDVTYGDIWFNGWKHLIEKMPKDQLGAKQAELAIGLIGDRKLPWNKAFKGKAVVLEDGPVTIDLDGVKLTLLSPYREQLHALVKNWKKELIAAGVVDAKGNLLAPELRAKKLRDTLGGGLLNVAALLQTPFESDTAEANGSSIAFLMEYRGTRVLFTGDAHAPVLVQSLKKIPKARRKIDALKVSHHGSKNNTSDELLALLECPTYLISTSGAQFEHPNRAAIARIINRRAAGAQLYFNYHSKFNDVWTNPTTQRDYRFKTVYPKAKGECVVVDLSSRP